MNKITTILFDMGNVLIDFIPEDIVSHYTKDPDTHQILTQAIFEGKEWGQLDLGIISDVEAITLISAKVPERLKDLVKTIVETWPITNRVRPQMIPLIKALKKKGYRLILASNASLRFYEYDQDIKALDYFDGLLISADIHHVKPEPMFYETLLSRFNLEASACFMIDDRLDNILSANALGIDGFVYTQDLKTLKKILKEKEIL